ncbi:MAG: fluoride efflux transporter CrcB [Lachnospiraceae bacterium]|jgi:CrcB protein|nr:fluoride efflux transporter CrcB [Lachnospiraceae bacterium]
MLDCIIVALGGACGALGRYLMGMIPVQPENGFPVKTFFINVIGSFLIGIIAALAAKNAVNPKLVTFIKVGICGGFTTFSSFALETDQLVHNGHTVIAFCYVIASIVCGVAAVFIAEKLIG